MTEYIKREDVLALSHYDDHDCEIVDVEDVEKLPAADVRSVVRGKWRLYSPLTDTYECDKCGYQVIDESFRTNYCPDCGAQMEES